MDDVRVRLFGAVRVEGLEAVRLGSRKARTLLAVLATSPGFPIATDRLIEALWLDSTPAAPSDQLGVLVSRLRHVLGARRILRCGNGFQLEADWVDLVEVTARLDDAEARLAAGAPGAALASCRAALHLAAAPLLADQDGAWADEQRRILSRRIARGRLLSSRSALAVGEPLTAAAAAEAVLDDDPYDEAALLALMRAHVAAGRPAVALAAYERVRRRLRTDLGADPGAEVQELHQRILRADDTGPETTGPVSSGRACGRPGATRLPGRDRDLAVLHAAFSEAADGGTRCVVVEGEPGIGKSALLRTFVEQVRRRATVMAGECDVLDRDLPLQPLLDGLEVLLRGLGPDGAARALGDDAPRVEPLLAAATAHTGWQVPVPGDPAEARTQLFAALLRVAQRAASSSPLLLVVDDLQHAGPATVAWLQLAARRGDRLLLMLAARPCDTPYPDGAQVLRLGPLELDVVRELVDPAQAEEAWRRSGGNPLLLNALDSGDVAIEQAVTRIVEAAGAAAPTLRAAAVLGPVVDLDLLAGICERPAAAVLDDLDVGVRLNLLVESADGLVFAHDLVRQVVAGRTTSARAAAMHRQAASVLMARDRHEPLAVARHARLGGNRALAAAALERAASTAVRRSDLDTAEHMLREAVDLDPTAETLLGLADVLVRRGAFGEAQTVTESVLAQSPGARAFELAGWIAYYQRQHQRALRWAEAGGARTDDPVAQSSSRALAGRIQHSLGALAAADAELGHAVAVAPRGQAGNASVWLAALRVHQGRPDEAMALMDDALLDGASVSHPFALGHGHFARWYALAMLGQPTAALADIDEFTRDPRTADLATTRFRPVACNMQSLVLRGIGQLDAAAEENARAMELAIFPKLSEPRDQAALDLAEIALLRGDLADAARRVDAVTLPAPEAGTMVWHQRERLDLLRARLALADGRPERAAELAQRLARDAAQRGSRRHEVVARLLLACARAQAAEPVDAGHVADVLVRLRSVAGLEAWRWTAVAAAHLGVEQWWDDAGTLLAQLAGRSGEYREQLLAFADRQLASARAGALPP